MFLLITGIAFSILIYSVPHLVTAQSENKTSVDKANNTRQIINLEDNTITLIDNTTNKIISTMPYVAENVTANTSGNNTTKDTTLSVSAENDTTNKTLTEKFKESNK